MSLKNVFNIILDYIFPSYCCVCKKRGEILCQKCFNDFEINNNFFCQKCMNPIFYNIHRSCSTTFFDGGGITFVVLKKNNNISKLISAFKYKFNFSLKEKLTKIIEKYILQNNINILQNTVITYVPITKMRLFWRGFNQSYHIANALSDVIKLPVVELLVKKVNTKTQATLSKIDRYKNVSNAFKCINIDYLDGIDNVIIVDDIITTGSTIKECINTIKKIKSDIKIYVFVLSHGTS